MKRIQKTKYRGLYIQVENRGKSIAWSSKTPSNNVLTAEGEVYFQVGELGTDVIEKLKREIDEILGEKE